MRITPIIAGLLVLSGTIGGTSLVLQRTALQAAEGSNADGISSEAADQTGLNKGTTTIEKKNPTDGSKEQLAIAKLEGCKSQFKLADLDGDGLLDTGDVAYYNSSIRSEQQPALPESGRLTEAGFIASCSSVSEHE
jgi:hypothetical protein